MLTRNLLAGLVAGAAALQSVSTQHVRADNPQSQPATEENVVVGVVEQVAAEVEEADGDEQVSATPLPKLWLGIALKGVEGDLATFLGSNSGVLIDQVQPESPAAKAGVMKGDIVLSVDGKDIAGPRNLLEFMSSASEGTPLKLQVRRKSEHVEISVTPELRPEQNTRVATTTFGEQAELDLAEGQLGNLRLKLRGMDIKPGPGSDENVYMFRLGDPSVLFVPDKVELQGNVTIQITKEDDGKTIEVKISKQPEQPAEITIKQGDEIQKLTEEQLDKIPEELRGWVQSALSGKKSKWVDLKELQSEYLPRLKGKRLELQQLGEWKELKELSKLLDTEQLGDKKVELQSLVEELTKNAKAQAQDALKKAMEQAGVSADQTAHQAKELALQYAEEVFQSAKQQAEQAKNQAKDAAKEVTQVEVELRGTAEQHAKHSEQISELKAMIEQLKNEIAELRSSK